MMKHEILRKFCETLTYLINAYEPTRHKFEVVYYNDADPNVPVDIGDVIKKRIQRILDHNH